MPIRVMIVDDEELARDEMRYLLGTEEGVEIVGEAAGGREAVALARESKPDVIFLDIQMPAMDGFQVVEELLRGGELPLVIFATAYDQYAIRAFEANALDYLLKPIEKERLHEAVERARRMRPGQREFVERVRRLAANIKVGTRFLPQIVLRKGQGVALIEVGKVAMLSFEQEKVKAYTSDGVFSTNYTDIDELEVQLDPALFMRLGMDRIVNLGRIAQILPWSGGHYIMALDDKERTEIQLTRSQAQLLKNKVGEGT